MDLKTLRHEILTFGMILLLLTGSTNSAPNKCTLRGQIHTSLEWYGYLLQKTFQQNVSLIEYAISYPVGECCANMLIYYDDQMRTLSKDMTCPEREKILSTPNQVIPLNVKNETVGCVRRHLRGQEVVWCVGERTLKSTSPRAWYVALSRCGAANTPITFEYEFNVTGFYGNCEDDPLDKTFIPAKEEVTTNSTGVHLAIALGVVAGVAIIVAVVFIVLFVISKRQLAQKPKTSGSVTSSQATMTQDIFYVNPSLSDREHSHSDSQYSRSSSENYYEVIPDRRSYESINTQLALHGGRTLNITGIPRDPRARIPSYIFEDVPPPPYQPPHGQGQGHGGQGHAHQGSNSSGHHSQGSGSGHPLLGTQSPYSGGGLHHIPLQTRFIPITTAQGLSGPVTMATTRVPLHSNLNGPISSGISSSGVQTTSFNTTSGGACADRDDAHNGGITTSAGGLNSHGNNAVSRTQMNDMTHPVTSQNGGQMQNGGTLGRYTFHNTNQGKLLNHNYRIQQFETTA
ncbi:uncharacterized protein LOC127848263 [Dreissena polymorpha]|uniref:GPR180-like N-terminal domain-containing protein n=1 Tax=Dreissena polymorpha TaxID=45954 RepID=A0A9D4I3M3_DREPO|nr:uncharacterized protein LOC127848263 [Dreissena polymorpha]XP_052236581.1 uncharacterized protein LOC127848263 [Dreissena polymorpha]XP_052236582.1 uncharacterized protein LOC127848263 [Dreissena polymorpha]XP_052236583.1 uncharacterized protein LOC127848263 [Dreissena polymorpha]XP_052236584.1 uncharacterized protein LOC127848263 [Dreissena polymorpha]XP_052236585.1 uncharacterized protein LOC127848263 [Dreissena polymorpha]XP_052236586.1 uncharacterized protein LOC127848263 [Dreissena po